MDLADVWKWVAGAVAALVTGGVVFKLTSSSRSSKDSSVRVVTQNNNRAGGDIIAGDSIKKTSK